LARFKKILLIILTSVIVLLAALWLLIQVSPVQNWIIGKITDKLSKDLNTKIAIQKVNFSLFNKMYLQGVLVEDRQKDTILSAGEIAVNITDWFFLKKNIELKYVGLKNAYIHLQRTDSVWRHQFLLDYFSSPESKNSNNNASINISLKKLDLENITFKQTDAWLGQDMTLSLASLYIDPKNIDLNKKNIQINSLDINEPYFALKSYKQNKPHRKRTKTSPAIPPQIDTSELNWNPEKWNIVANKISLHDGVFKNDDASSTLDATAFDGQHILFSKINIDFTNVEWSLDTITANMNLSTKERSGFEVKHLIANVKVTPEQMSFKNLDIHTNKSSLSNYFSMKYSSFDAMNDFVDSVKLEGIFDKSEITSLA
jgi:autotransporter translocation and assembly factor TamB